MKYQSLPFLLASLIVAAACGKKANQPAPYTGPVTFERITQAQAAVHLHDNWDDALANVSAIAGAPTSKTDSKATWALADGTSCAYVTMERKDDHVGSKSAQPKIAKADFGPGPSTFTECESTASAK